MTDILPILFVCVGIAGCCWFSYRWGRDAGRADGYADGLADAAMQSGTVSPSAVGGPGAVPR